LIHGELVDTLQRSRIIALQDTWRDAKEAYSAHASKYVAAWWMGDGPPATMPEPLTRAAFDELTRLRAARDAAGAAYHGALDQR